MKHNGLIEQQEIPFN